jgi:hypothetical protein
MLRRIISELNSSGSNTNGGSSSSNGGRMAAATAAQSSPQSSQPGTAAAAPAGGKKLSKSKLLGEVAQLRQAKAAAELGRAELLQRLGTLAAEKVWER